MFNVRFCTNIKNRVGLQVFWRLFVVCLTTLLWTSNTKTDEGIKDWIIVELVNSYGAEKGIKRITKKQSEWRWD
jgi:hypothetical protein